MDFSSPPVFWTAYISSNLVALLMLLSSWKKPAVARFLYFLLFGWASIVNHRTATYTPEVYQEYADYAILPFYRSFILGWFTGHITTTVNTIAAVQLFISLSMWGKGWFFKAGAICGIVFLVAIAPLGLASAIPATLMMAFGLWLLLRQLHIRYLWHTLFKEVSVNGDRFSDDSTS